MSNDIVTIVVPVYNAEKTILTCLDSIQAQTYLWLDIIIVDDCSTDQTSFLINDFIVKNSRFRLIQQTTNQGASAARNCGIKLAKGSLLYFIDADDWITPNVISNFVKFYKDNKMSLVCGGHTQCKDDKFFITKNCELDSDTLFSTREFISYVKDYLRIPYKYLLPVHCWNKLYNLKVIQTYNLQFDTNLSQLEDVSFNFRYLMYVDTIKFNLSFDYYHRIDSLNNSYSSKAGTEYDAVNKCIRAFSPIKDYLIKKDANNEIDHITELGHHFITTSIIIILRLVRHFLKKPNMTDVKRIREWVSSPLFHTNIQYYERQPNESRIIHAALKTRSTTLIFIAALYRVIMKR